MTTIVKTVCDFCDKEIWMSYFGLLLNRHAGNIEKDDEHISLDMCDNCKEIILDILKFPKLLINQNKS